MRKTLQLSDQTRFRLVLMLGAITGTLFSPLSAKMVRGEYFSPGNLVVSRSVYDNNPSNITVGTILPPNCSSSCVTATDDGEYPLVWNNNLVDSSFGITSKIFLDQMTPSGMLINSLEAPNSTQKGVQPGPSDDAGDDGESHPSKNQLVTSFSSKSELALNLSTDGHFLTFMGYIAPIDALDVSNSNTPGAVDPTNPVAESFYRAVAQVDQDGNFRFTETNAYSGNNGRAAILNNTKMTHLYYTSGNAGNGGNPQPDGIIIGAGAQILTPSKVKETAQTPGIPTPVASFNISQLGFAQDKIGKDDNFRGLTIFDNILYYSKGSGGNGVNTVYFVDTTGLACPNGIGLPHSLASLPTSGLPYDSTLLQTKGLEPNNMCILKGFPSALKSKTSFPFGIWFANANTVYVADEGNGDNTYSLSAGTYTKAAGQTTAGLQKWVFDAGLGQWKLAYTLQTGLALGVPYVVPNYPSGNNPASGLPWAPATDGLRNLTGRVNDDGTVTLWAITSTVSGNGDQGADPNKLVAITDALANTSAPVAITESFTTLRTAGYGEVLRGVSFAPGTDVAER